MPTSTTASQPGATIKAVLPNYTNPGGNLSSTGANTILQGYNAGISNLSNAVNLAGNTTSGELMALQKQLQTNTGNVQQGLANSGLGNSTIEQNMLQTPLQTYNLAATNAQNQGALLQMGALQNLANAEEQGGQAAANYTQPFQLGSMEMNNARVPTGIQNMTPGYNPLGSAGASIMTGAGGDQPGAYYQGSDAGGSDAGGSSVNYLSGLSDILNEMDSTDQSADTGSIGSINGTSYDANGNPIGAIMSPAMFGALSGSVDSGGGD